MQTQKQILITAGSVWVPIDRVRVITNIFTGNTGLAIALEAARRGFAVTLLLGPGGAKIPASWPDNLKIINFKYYDELYNLTKEHVASGKMSALVHTAAVPDYVPTEVFDGKIKSGQENLSISFKPTVKIVDQVKIWDPQIFLVKFKLEVGLGVAELFAKAGESMSHSRADLIVANDLSGYQARKAFIIDPAGNMVECLGNENISANLVDIISKKMGLTPCE